MYNKNEKNVIHIADIVGEWGKWQFHLLAFCFIMYAMGAITNMGYTFHAFNNDFWCHDVPEDYPNKTNAMKCHTFSNPNESCIEWQYDKSQFKRSIVTEFNLVCDRTNFASLTQTSYMLSYIISGLLLSHLQDRYGRRPLIWVAMIIEILGTLSCALSVNMTQYIISRFFVGLGGSGRGAFGVIIFEYAGPKHRSEISIFSGMGWIVGYCLLPGYAYWLSDYRLMQYISLIWMSLMLVWFYFLDESPRWQLTTGRTDRAEKTIRKALKVNGKSDNNLKTQLNQLTSHLQRIKTESESEQRVTLLDLFKTPKLRKYTLIFFYLGITNALIYYGFSLNMSDFGGNFYITFLLSGLVELPSSFVTVFLLRYIGRNLLFGLYMFIITIASIGVIFSDNTVLNVSLALIGKFSVTSSWMVKGIHQGEVLPTILRQTGNGAVSMVSRIGAISAPFMKNLAAKTDLSVVMAIYAFSALTAGLIGFMLPETKGVEIPDTINETENLSSKKRRQLNETVI